MGLYDVFLTLCSVVWLTGFAYVVSVVFSCFSLHFTLLGIGPFPPLLWGHSPYEDKIIQGAFAREKKNRLF